ncbi:peptide ABC transporter substrate-binding protein [Planctomycetota bacterium]|nr:peptide ABC transporter substrate-binding protein [Planctomycetota bacterium]
MPPRLILVLAFVLAPWSALAAADDAWKKVPQELVFINESEPQTIDPGLMTGLLESRLAGGLFEGLCRLHPKTLEPLPGVAERWTVADGVTYTFHLRAGAAWSDGKPIVAQDFVSSWKRVLTPATGSEYASQLYPIAGAEAFHKGKSTDWTTVGVNATDERTLTVRLHRPCPWFLSLCAFQTLFPVRVDLIALHGDRWTRAGNIVSNGPFRLVAWEPRVSIIMVRNEHYWDRAAVRLTKVTALPTDDLDTAWRLYQQGGIHWMPGVPQARFEQISRHPDFSVTPTLGAYFYRFNCTKPPFDDARVRRAFSLAIDRAAITKFVTKFGEIPNAGLIPKMPGYDPPTFPLTDRAEARRQLAAAGYATPDAAGKPLPPIDILFNTSENHKAIAEAIAAQWKDALGATVAARSSEWKVYLDAQTTLAYQVCRSAWYADYADPNTFIDLWTTGNGNNRTGWGSPEYDRLVDASQRATDPAERAKLIRRMETMLVAEECPIAPIYSYVSKSLRKESLAGFYDNPLDQHPLRDLWIEP